MVTFLKTDQLFAGSEREFDPTDLIVFSSVTWTPITGQEAIFAL